MKNNKYRWIVSLLVLTLLLTSFVLSPVYAAGSNFKDFKKGDGGYEEVMELVDQGVLRGYPDGKFNPYRSVTREQAAIMLTKALNLPVPKDLSKALKDYKDVKPTYVNAKQIAAVTEAGVFKGSKGKFHPNQGVSRSQMATILVKAFDLKGTGDKVDFTDLNKIDISHRENVKILAQNQISVGKQLPNGKRYFDGNAQLNRVQFAILLKKTMDLDSFDIVEIS